MRPRSHSVPQIMPHVRDGTDTSIHAGTLAPKVRNASRVGSQIVS